MKYRRPRSEKYDDLPEPPPKRERRQSGLTVRSHRWRNCSQNGSEELNSQQYEVPSSNESQSDSGYESGSFASSQSEDYTSRSSMTSRSPLEPTKKRISTCVTVSLLVIIATVILLLTLNPELVSKTNEKQKVEEIEMSSSHPSIAPSPSLTSVTSSETIQPTALVRFVYPTTLRTNLPSSIQSIQPIAYPDMELSASPTMDASIKPSVSPTSVIVKESSPVAESNTTIKPSAQPSIIPILTPTSKSSDNPSSNPSSTPTILPSGRPSSTPSLMPTETPSIQPTMLPTGSFFQWHEIGNTIFGNDDSVSITDFGKSVAISSDGSTIAISRYMDNEVVVYDMGVGGTWRKRGTIVGPENSWFGFVVSMSGDGQTVAGGGYTWDSGKGLVQVWRWNESESSWIQLGNTLYGSNDSDNFGRSIHLLESDNGIDVLIGSKDSSNGSRGSARVVNFDGASWNQRGSTIRGDSDDDGLGVMPDSVAISDNGNVIAIGAYHGKYVRTLRWGGSDWEILDADVKSFIMWFGASVALKGQSGSYILAVGSPSTYGGGSIYFYKWNGIKWSILPALQVSSSSYIGYQLSLSENGKTVMTATDSAAVVFDYDGTKWEQRGTSVLEVDGDPLGREWATTDIIVDMSGDGNKVIVGLPVDDDGFFHGDNIGQVHCFEWRR